MTELVRFVYPARRLDANVIRLLHDTLGFEGPPLNEARDLVVECTLEQFARFLIERNDRGISNTFMELKR